MNKECRVLLLVEHDEATAASQAQLLETEGYRVISVRTGTEAILTVNRLHGGIDLILMDIDPDDGLDGTLAAREILKLQPIPILFLSSHTDKEFVEKTENISSYGFVLKNSGDFVLLASIKMAFRLHEAHQREQSKDNELKDSEVRFRTAFENAAIGMSLTNLNGSLLKVNFAFAEMLGLTPEEMQRCNFSALTHPDDRALSKESSRLLLEGEQKVRRFIKRYLHKDGHVVWADLSIVLLRNGRGEPLVFISQIQDITEHKKSEDLLVEQEYWLRECQRVGRIGSYDLDIGSNTWTSSAVLDDLLGIDREQKKTLESWNAIVHPDERGEMLHYFLHTVVGEKTPFDKEYRIVRQSDGQERWVWGRGELHYNLDGTPMHMIGTIQDITERKHAERGLRESESRFREIFDKAPLGYHELDEDGRIVRVNTTEATKLGYTPEEMVGQYAWKYVENEAQSQMVTLQKLRGECAPGQSFEREFRRKDGTIIHALLDDALLRNPEGKIIGLRTTLQDITDRKRLEQQLLQSQKLEGVGTLAGGIAHDFNNLLAMILGSAELLRLHTVDKPELSKYVDRIVGASERGKSISRQLLIFSRPDQAELKPISLSQTITELEDLLHHFLPKSISIVTKIEVTNGIIMGDAGQIHQALLNLALNAGDAMTNHGTLTIKEFSVTETFIKNKFGVDGDVPFVAVSISDTGRGMEKRMIEKIFDPFFSTKERGKGTGLGLAIVHGIINNHHGFVDVETILGKGTTFTLFFPAVPLEKNEQSTADPDSMEKNTEHILIVDDEELLRETLAEYLTESGYSVFTASNGREAMDLFVQHHALIDLVVTDLGMPEMGGEELYRQLRKIDANAKVLVSSGYLDGTTKNDLLEMGIKDVLTKPFKMQDISASIKNALHEPACVT
jgi:PAS domain S-box-containing protein